jgi:hypothetical protein
MEGEDSEKLNFLQQRAKLDYLIAESFPRLKEYVDGLA